MGQSGAFAPAVLPLVLERDSGSMLRPASAPRNPGASISQASRGTAGRIDARETYRLARPSSPCSQLHGGACGPGPDRGDAESGNSPGGRAGLSATSQSWPECAQPDSGDQRMCRTHSKRTRVFGRKGVGVHSASARWSRSFPNHRRDAGGGPGSAHSAARAAGRENPKVTGLTSRVTGLTSRALENFFQDDETRAQGG